MYRKCSSCHTKKNEKNINFFEINSIGYRNEEHPTGFHTIKMQVNLKSTNTTSDEMVKAFEMIKKICPALSMLDANIRVDIEYKISV